MNFLEFRTRMFPLACYNVNQVYAWQPDFNRLPCEKEAFFMEKVNKSNRKELEISFLS